MSKRKKSRLTKTDVNAICEMQRKIDAYENYILAICAHTLKGKPKRCAFMRGTDMDDWVDMAVRNIDQMKDDLERLAQEEEARKMPKQENL